MGDELEDGDKKKASAVISAISSKKQKDDRFSVYDGGRATQWARKQLRNLRDNQATAHRLKLESMFSFLPKKLIEVVDSELTDDKGVAKNQILPSPSKTDFYGVLVMADLVKSTVLSEEMEDKAFAENCGGGLDSIEEDDMARSHRKGSIYEGEGSKSSHNRAAMAKNAIKKQAHKLRDAQNDASKLGAERLRTVLTKYFRLLVGVTMNHGGDVVRIAGDAIISIFEDNSKSIKRSLAKAQSACLDILNSYNNYVIDGNTLQVRLYMAIGSLSIFCVGGYQGRWEYMISGKPFAELKAMGDCNEPGELCMSGDCWDILYSNTSKKLNREAFEFVDLRKNGIKVGIKQTTTPSMGQFGAKTCVLLKVDKDEEDEDSGYDNLDDEALFRKDNDVRRGSLVYHDEKKNSLLITSRTFSKSKRQALVSKAKNNKIFEARLKHFVPCPVTYHCDHQNIDLDWMEEAAQCSAMFVTFKETISDLAGIQRVFLALQRIITENSGIIKEFSMDDKGLVLVVGFGLQPNVLPNPAASACLAALQIKHSHTIGVDSKLYIGIGTGQVFCAAIGSDFRREFALVGKVVNLAARLAFFARKIKSNKQVKPDDNLDICVDSLTMNLAKSRIDFVVNKQAKNVTLKGIKGTTNVYCPTEPRYIQLLEMANLVNSATVGRKEEQDTIMAKLEALYDDLDGGILVIKGQPGVGKTHLIHQIVKSNQRMQNLLVFKGNGTRETINQNIRMSLAPQSFQCSQVEGLDSWVTVMIKLFTMFREGCLEPENGVAWKDEEYKMIKYAYTKYAPGNLTSLDNDNGDTIKGRTFFIKTVGERFLKDHMDSLFLMNFLLAINLPVVKDLNNISEEACLERTIDVVEAALNVLVRFSPVAIVFDDAHYCDVQSIRMIKEIASRMHNEVLIIISSKTGYRHLPDIRLHVPKMQAAFANQRAMKHTIIATSAFSLGLKKPKGAEEGGGEEKKEDKKDGRMSPVMENKPKKKPVPPKLSKRGKLESLKATTKSPRKSLMEKRMQMKKEAKIRTKDQIMVGKIELVTKVEEDINSTVMDEMLEELKAENTQCSVTDILLNNLNFNETIAMTAMILGTEKICNITAAAMYGHTQGNPKYVKLFASYLMDPGPDESFGGPIQNFDENLTLSKERTWTLKEPRIPEVFLSYMPPEILDEVRVALKNCTAQQMWILKVMSVVGGSDCPIHLLEELLEDAVLSVNRLEDDLCELIAMGIIEHTVVKAIKPVDTELSTVDKLMMAQGGGNQGNDEEDGLSYLTYTFINVHCQTACYQMLSFSRRSELHLATAQWYEDKLNIERGEESDIDGYDNEEGDNAMKKSKAPVIDPNYKNISKKYACFVIHHYFMASRVEISIGICEMIGTMEIQHWAGQYARKVLTKMPLEMPDAIFHRIYPCIRWLQGVSSIINALKKGKVGFGTIAAGKMVSKKLDMFRKKKVESKGSSGDKQGSVRTASTVTSNSRKKTIVDNNKRLTQALGMLSLNKSLSPGKGSPGSGSPPTVQSKSLKVEDGVAGEKGGEGSGNNVGEGKAPNNSMRKKSVAKVKADETKKKIKLANYGAAYGGKAASKAVEKVKKKDDEDVLSREASFQGISWSGMINRTKAKIRKTMKFKLFQGEKGLLGGVAEEDEEFEPGLSTRRLLDSSEKALKMGASGIPSETSLKNFSEPPYKPSSPSKGTKSKRERVTAMFALGGKKNISQQSSSVSSRLTDEQLNFWAPDFDIKVALADAPSEEEENSQEGSDEGPMDDFNSFNSQLRGYIDLLKEQHSIK
eukprot:CAMPEP_0118648764 /NCGR_PEP_ID=MMETSP0785-20121206/9336_1 /TAXON_ID=91992 /ORGANISM="Bolidomonas pacifica, Strain CCMP 1866" /LENGTH=1776 /DNA_ID=CAMNT_0006540991 /DNA_START=129 /DNA_END=5456 /DNA_ORIENTATION=+